MEENTKVTTAPVADAGVAPKEGKKFAKRIVLFVKTTLMPLTIRTSTL